MAKPHDRHSGGSHRDDDDGGEGRHREREEREDVRVHLEIEARRFRGGLPPTPERYARAREQWNRLPGAIVRPSTDANPVQESRLAGKGGER